MAPGGFEHVTSLAATTPLSTGFECEINAAPVQSGCSLRNRAACCCSTKKHCRTARRLAAPVPTPPHALTQPLPVRIQVPSWSEPQLEGISLLSSAETVLP